MDLQADLFADIVVIFVAAFLGGTAARLLRLPTLLGYMSVGLLVGPHALGLISNVEVVRTLAELGVVLLLFAVGVEISMAELRTMGRRIVAIGLGQLGGTLAGFKLQAVYHDFSADKGGDDYGSELDLLAARKFGDVTLLAKYASYNKLGRGKLFM